MRFQSRGNCCWDKVNVKRWHIYRLNNGCSTVLEDIISMPIAIFGSRQVRASNTSASENSMFSIYSEGQGIVLRSGTVRELMVKTELKYLLNRFALPQSK